MRKGYAIVAGVNDYPGTGLDLSGCVNDALDMSAMLQSYAPNPYEIKTFIDSAATKGNIVDALTDAVERAGWGDRIIYHWSGHGTWTYDEDGDEVDGRDEAQCLYDFQNQGLLVDDELHEIFSNTRSGVGTLILSDSCFSGTLTRFAPLTELSGTIDERSEPRFLPPSLFKDITVEEAAEMEEAVSKTQPRQTTSLISGCKDDEYSYDAWFGDRPNGAFTRTAIDAYRPGVTLKGWYNAIAALLPSSQYPQSPQLTYANRYRAYSRPF